ncbi:MAG: hypothetical protein IJ341_02265 [Bacteroidales bacterium]|nr:hypothetical protein [Bacteroidales bacterium]
MRIDLPGCDFKNCRFCFDGNCRSKEKFDNCDYQYMKRLTLRKVVELLPPSCNVIIIDSDTKKPLEGETVDNLTADFLECSVTGIAALNLNVKVKVEGKNLNDLNM